MRRLLASKSKNELLNVIRDLYALTIDNKDFIHAQILTPKPTAPKARQPKQPPSSTSKVVSKIRQLATMAALFWSGMLGLKNGCSRRQNNSLMLGSIMQPRRRLPFEILAF